MSADKRMGYRLGAMGAALGALLLAMGIGYASRHLLHGPWNEHMSKHPQDRYISGVVTDIKTTQEREFGYNRDFLDIQIVSLDENHQPTRTNAVRFLDNSNLGNFVREHWSSANALTTNRARIELSPPNQYPTSNPLVLYDATKFKSLNGKEFKP